MLNKDYYDLTVVDDVQEAVELAAEVLDHDGVILTPTDTVYGLLCLPGSEKAIQAIFDMKQRPLNRKLPIIAADLEQVEQELPLVVNDDARALARAFWPGALTLACRVADNSLPWLAGRAEAAVRVPDYPFIRQLARKLGPLLMTSANRHGIDTPHTVEGALESLSGRPGLSLNGGVLSGAPSTLVNVNLPTPKVERVGSIPLEEIEKIIHSSE